MKTLILATSALMTLGLGSVLAGTPAAQGPPQLAQQQMRPLSEPPAYQNRLFPDNQLAQQQMRPLSEPPAYQIACSRITNWRSSRCAR